jgi:hypothetical protein
LSFVAEEGGQGGIRINQGALADKRDSGRRVIKEKLSEKELIALTGSHVESVEGPGKHLSQSFEDFVARGGKGRNRPGVKGQDRAGGPSAIEREKGSLATARRLKCLPPLLPPHPPKSAREIGDKQGSPKTESLSFKDESGGVCCASEAMQSLVAGRCTRQCDRTEIPIPVRSNNPDRGKAPRFLKLNTNSRKELVFGTLFGDKRGGRYQKAVETGEASDLPFEGFIARDFSNLSQKKKPLSKETSFQTDLSKDRLTVLAGQERRKDLLLMSRRKGVRSLPAPRPKREPLYFAGGKPCGSEEGGIGDKQYPLRIEEKEVPGRLLKQPGGKIDGRRHGALERPRGRGIGWD